MSTTNEKMVRLQQAFGKALEVSIESTREADLKDCFGDVKVQLGDDLQRLVQEMMTRVGGRMLESFEEITKDNLVEALVSNLSYEQQSPDVDDEDSPAPDEDLKDLLIKLKKAEITEVKQGIKVLETEIKTKKDVESRLRTQMVNEIEALNEENLKIKHAANMGSQDESHY
jgi:hypothetical protein